MEPLFEIADRITSHVWFLHEVLPLERDVSIVLNAASSEDLKRSTAEDYAKLAAVRDLADVSCPDDAVRGNPLPHVNLPAAAKTPFWNMIKRLRLRRKIQDDGQDEDLKRRVIAAEEAFVVLQARSESLLTAGIQGVSLDASAENEEELASPPASLTSDELSSQLLTSDELFERVLHWLCSLGIEQKIKLAQDFLPLNGENRKCGGGNTDEQGDGKTRSRFPGLIGAWIRDLAKQKTPTRFLLEENIDERAAAIRRNKAFPIGQRELTAEWLTKNGEDRIRVLLDRAALHNLCHDLDVPVPFSMVLSEELDEIGKSRRLRLPDCEPGTGLSDAHCSPGKRAFQSKLFGLALSGGGIRSATFNLGLLQGMADRNVLPYIDILSSVSGGGYIASWLMGWTKRRGHIKSVQDSLKGYASPLECTPTNAGSPPCSDTPRFGLLSRNQDPHADHLRPVRLLREYARYLAPQAGLLSADTWTILTTWLRNTVLNLTILLLVFGVLLLLPRMAAFTLFHLQWFVKPTDNDLHSWLCLFAAGAPFLFICGLIGQGNLKYLGTEAEDAKELAKGYSDARVVTNIALPLLLESFLYVAVLWNLDVAGRPLFASSPFLIITLLGSAILHHSSGAQDKGNGTPLWLQAVISSVSAGVAFLLLCLLCSAITSLRMNTLRGLWIASAFGPALFLMVVGTTILVLQGLSGTLLSDAQREWWSRLGAWLLITTAAWVIISTICFFMPLWIAIAGLKIAAAGIAWGSLTAAGVKLAFSGKRGGKEGEESQPWLISLVLKIAPGIFVIGLLSLMSYLLFYLVNLSIDLWIAHGPKWMWAFLVDNQTAHQLCCTNLPLTFERMSAYYWPLMNPGSLAPVLLCVVLILACWPLARQVDINEFSMHHFYRNRLVRAYLGASRTRGHRFPNAFTGFDIEDDIPLKRFSIDDTTDIRDMVTDCKKGYAGPFPIINTALNITKGQDLGMQERRAEAFFFSPLWSGFDFARKQTKVRKSAQLEFGFRRTDQFGSRESLPPAGNQSQTRLTREGVSLGTAMAISGAAFSSNAGYHTSPSLSFLLTVFGVRLGWWAGNPRGPRWDTDSPQVGLQWLLRELTANTETDGDYVLLTDGGHFENMGLYELVRRRCRYVIVSDAEEDEEFKLEGIGGAIRKCRDDFGVVITLNVNALQPIGDPARSTLHYSVGTIRYPGEEKCGNLVYIKSSLTNDEALDLVEFGKRHKEFPHTSTSNQFFDESHFESYRELGHHIASVVFQHDMNCDGEKEKATIPGNLEDMFECIEHRWGESLAAAEGKARAEKAAGTSARGAQSGGGA
ncbi:MAG TPA: hypothetical protein VKB38_09535 [Terracidiphilus sp.]|nr:hypothetical protein [Terracidiphilus sp.]